MKVDAFTLTAACSPLEVRDIPFIIFLHGNNNNKKGQLHYTLSPFTVERTILKDVYLIYDTACISRFITVSSSNFSKKF